MTADPTSGNEVPRSWKELESVTKWDVRITMYSNSKDGVLVIICHHVGNRAVAEYQLIKKTATLRCSDKHVC